MKVDAVLTWDLEKAGNEARELEEMGYAGLKTIETAHDPFLPLVAAAQSTDRVDLATGIAVAFARSPMTLANIGHDLNAASKGRLILGLGSQIRPHITKRFSMLWSSPAKRMREMILAMRAIWANWHNGEPLEFVGDFYTHTLMTEVAGEVADGILVHGFTTRAYLEQVTLPRLEKGLAKAGKSRADFEIAYPVFSVTGRDEKEVEAARKSMREKIAFYGSTPAYKGVLDSVGAGELQAELNAMSKRGRWEEMGHLIDDDLFDKFAIVGDAKQIARQIQDRYGDIIDRTAAAYADMDRAAKIDFIETLKATSGAR